MSKVMIKLKGLLLLLISVMVLNGCKETPSGMVENLTHTELEIKNNINIKDRWWVDRVEVNEDYNFGIEIEPQSSRVILFSEEKIGSDLTNLQVKLGIRYQGYTYFLKTLTTHLDFKLGERRIIRVDCNNFYSDGLCRTDGIILTIED